jgi:hypothetical protein
LLTIDFITALLAFSVDSVLLIALSATKHHSQLPYDKNFYSINADSQLSLTHQIFGRVASSLLQPLAMLRRPTGKGSLFTFSLQIFAFPYSFASGVVVDSAFLCTKSQISEGDLE